MVESKPLTGLLRPVFLFLLLALALPAHSGTLVSGSIASTTPNTTGASYACGPAGDIYYALPHLNGNQTDTFYIYKWTATTRTWALLTSIPTAGTFNAGFDFFGSLAMAADSTNLHVAFVGKALRNNASGNSFAMDAGLYYAKYSSSTWSSATAIASQTLPTVWTETLDAWNNPRLQLDADGKVNAVYEYNNHTNSNHYILARIQATVGGSTFSAAGTLLTSTRNQTLAYLVKDATGILSAVYSIEAAAGNDYYVASSPDWGTSTLAIDNTTGLTYYYVYGMAPDSAGKLHILFGDDDHGFGVITNTGGTWTAPASSYIATHTALDTPFDAPVFQIGSTGALVIDSTNNKFFLCNQADGAYGPTTTWYFYGQAGGTSTWVKGYTNLTALNALAGISNIEACVFNTPSNKMMVTYVDPDAKTATYVRGLQSDFVAITPTLITLASFTARPSSSQVALAWTTGSELDTAGFNLWRASAAGGAYARLNASLIPSAGTGVGGASYAFADTDVKTGQTWFYKLEDIDTSGVSAYHGPLSATLGGSAIQSFTATPPAIFLGGSTLLGWTTTGAPTLSLSGLGTVSGSSLRLAPLATTSYTLSDTQGDATLVTVTVKAFSLQDLAGLSKAWGTRQGEAAYDPCFDLDADGRIDDADVALCFKSL